MDIFKDNLDFLDLKDPSSTQLKPSLGHYNEESLSQTVKLMHENSPNREDSLNNNNLASTCKPNRALGLAQSSSGDGGHVTDLHSTRLYETYEQSSSGDGDHVTDLYSPRLYETYEQSNRRECSSSTHRQADKPTQRVHKSSIERQDSITQDIGLGDCAQTGNTLSVERVGTADSQANTHDLLARLDTTNGSFKHPLEEAQDETCPNKYQYLHVLQKMFPSHTLCFNDVPDTSSTNKQIREHSQSYPGRPGGCNDETEHYTSRQNILLSCRDCSHSLTYDLGKGRSSQDVDGLCKGRSSQDVDGLGKGRSSKDVDGLSKRRSSQDVDGLAKGRASQGVDGLGKGRSSHDVDGLGKGRSNQDVDGLAKGRSSQGVDGLGKGRASQDVDGFGKGRSSQDVDGLGKGRSSQDVDGLAKGRSSQDVDGLGKGRSSQDVDGLGTGTSSQGVDGLGKGRSSQGVDGLGTGRSSQDVDGLGKGRASQDVDGLGTGRSSQGVDGLAKGRSSQDVDGLGKGRSSQDVDGLAMEGSNTWDWHSVIKKEVAMFVLIGLLAFGVFHLHGRVEAVERGLGLSLARGCSCVKDAESTENGATSPGLHPGLDDLLTQTLPGLGNDQQESATTNGAIHSNRLKNYLKNKNSGKFRETHFSSNEQRLNISPTKSHTLLETAETAREMPLAKSDGEGPDFFKNALSISSIDKETVIEPAHGYPDSDNVRFGGGMRSQRDTGERENSRNISSGTREPDKELINHITKGGGEERGEGGGQEKELKSNSEVYEARFYELFPYNTNFLDKVCAHHSLWKKGIVGCRNVTIKLLHKYSILPIYTATKETASKAPDQRLMMIKNDSPGTFVVNIPGDYLVQLNIFIAVEKYNQHYDSNHFLAIFLNGQTTLACHHGGFRCPHTDICPSQKYKICNIIGMLHLNRNDTLDIRTMENDMAVAIDIRKSTFFRVLLLNKSA